MGAQKNLNPLVLVGLFIAAYVAASYISTSTGEYTNIYLPLTTIILIFASYYLTPKKPEKFNSFDEEEEYKNLRNNYIGYKALVLIIGIKIISIFETNYGVIAYETFDYHAYQVSYTYCIFMFTCMAVPFQRVYTRVITFMSAMLFSCWFASVVTSDIGHSTGIKKRGSLELFRGNLFDTPHTFGQSIIPGFEFQNGFITLVYSILVAMILVYALNKLKERSEETLAEALAKEANLAKTKTGNNIIDDNINKKLEEIQTLNWEKKKLLTRLNKGGITNHQKKSLNQEIEAVKAKIKSIEDEIVLLEDEKATNSMVMADLNK